MMKRPEDLDEFFRKASPDVVCLAELWVMELEAQLKECERCFDEQNAALGEELDKNEELEARIKKAIAEHTMFESDHGTRDCAECGFGWPCDTIRFLRGEKE